MAFYFQHIAIISDDVIKTDALWADVLAVGLMALTEIPPKGIEQPPAARPTVTTIALYGYRCAKSPDSPESHSETLKS